jgi:hypothetical protein
MMATMRRWTALARRREKTGDAQIYLLERAVCLLRLQCLFLQKSAHPVFNMKNIFIELKCIFRINGSIQDIVFFLNLKD